MRYIVFSDVHGNLTALEKVLNFEDSNIGFICLGDVVNYGPWSNECVELIDSLPNCIKILGNHEGYFLESRYDGNHPVARAFYEFCKPKFSKYDLLKDYVSNYELGDWLFQHTINDEYIFPDTNIDILRNTMIGHSHRQFVKYDAGNILCNVGSVGQNRKYIDMINYAVFDIERKSIECKSLTYDVELFINEMKAKKYPQICLNYYQNKRRINK